MSIAKKSLALATAGIAYLVLSSPQVYAQGCVAAKVDTPIFGSLPMRAKTEERQEFRKTFSLNWRYQVSDRHFVGTKEEKHRQKEGSEVINRLNVLDVGFALELDENWNISVGIPLQMAERSSPVRDDNRDVIARSYTHARGLGDIIATANRWIIRPEAEGNAAFRVGLGVKLPTGMNNIMDTRKRYVEGEIVRSVETVDQSIQPGDGGFGFLLNVLAGYNIGETPLSLYFSALYLFNPQGSKGVHTYRGRESESEMSIADQYVYRAGLSYSISGENHTVIGLGARMEGVPAEDLIGPSEDFRRPGYAVSVEPSVNYSFDQHTLTLAVPVAVQRNRTRSVSDKREGRHGDAAFADYVVLAGYAIRY